MKTTILRIALPLALSLAACHTDGGGDLGRVPSDLVDLYDMGSPAGVLELELERDGRIREMEVDVDPSKLPTALRDVVLQRMPGAQITGAEREFKAGGLKAWEVKFHHEGRDWEYVLDGQGAVVETEMSLDRDEAPRAVLDAAEVALPGGEFKSVELVESSAQKEYHVKKVLGGASYKLVIAPNGQVLRKVREARAEIEIPVAR